MAKRKIDIWEHAGDIIRALQPGILLTTKVGDKVNSMAIGWGTIGIQWEKPVFIAFVRTCRFTHEMLEGNGEFTVNVPVGEFPRKALGLLGSKSGRDMDKIAAAGVTLVEPNVISVPGIKEFPLTLECRVLYHQLQHDNELNDELTQRFYTRETANHTAFYAEIVDAYIIED
ncbi:MAG: flavin reductase family protein [Paludibacteraceae bacterium]|nr:flavin reductase family protein [Paludibacteraceae bacterium]MBQ6763932.1 flavin reductase family protein [Paludibacteraceae bacterium]